MACSIEILEPTEKSIKMLLLLMKDGDEDVRDWATFEIGQSNIGNDAVRQALFARLNDHHQDTHMEAVIGLARRGDKRAIPALIVEFKKERQQDDWHLGIAWIEAAADLAAPELVPYLEAMLEWRTDGVGYLNLAIRRCKGEDRPDGLSFGIQSDGED